MKYYVYEIIKIKEGNEDRPAPYAFESLDAALKKYHQLLGQDILGDVVEYCLIMVVNEYGKVEASQRWEAAE